MKGAGSRRLAALIAVGALVVVGAWLLQRQEYKPGEVRVVVPDLSPAARAGQQAFDGKCAECHGAHARGGTKGPPLVHPAYRRAHHADIAFELAVRQGVRAHHWRFDDMPPQPSVTAVEISGITRYVRELQAANGID